ncbi:transforming acidic coiled-coil-containing protein 3 isoform X2 [Ischnura elegans]|uniref:transforming acidic coiled-coil-containing protein 3 isoform X2 n=1 Tax=Ischnura elegans TaxID=197161 RepID=UPI001ED89B73|nr:transforming acidic coiled-coil-containing protein 3 isoform X2 [Ischnura elegans]
MDFLVRLIHSPSKKGGKGKAGGEREREKEKQPQSVASCSLSEDEREDWRERTAVITKVDHESYVQLAREFVEELVTTAHEKSEKELVGVIDAETNSVASASVSDGSFQSYGQVNGNPSTYLPDLLQPEAVYKRQTETDTDTNGYESATETEAPDVSEFQDLASTSEGPLSEQVCVPATAASLSNLGQSVSSSSLELPLDVDPRHNPSVKSQDLSESFIGQFQRLDIHSISEAFHPERVGQDCELGNVSTDSSTGDSIFFPCDSSFVGSEKSVTANDSDSSLIDNHVVSNDVPIAIINEEVQKGLKSDNTVLLAAGPEGCHADASLKSVDQYLLIQEEKSRAQDLTVGGNSSVVEGLIEAAEVSLVKESQHQGPSPADQTFFVETDSSEPFEKDLSSKYGHGLTATSNACEVDTQDKVSLSAVKYYENEVIENADGDVESITNDSKALTNTSGHSVALQDPIQSTDAAPVSFSEGGFFLQSVEGVHGNQELALKDVHSAPSSSTCENYAVSSSSGNLKNRDGDESVGKQDLGHQNIVPVLIEVGTPNAKEDKKELTPRVSPPEVSISRTLDSVNSADSSLFVEHLTTTKTELVQQSFSSEPLCGGATAQESFLEVGESVALKDSSFVSGSSHDCSLSDANVTVVVVGDECVDEKAPNEESGYDAVERTIQKDALCRAQEEESLLLSKLKDLCCSQEKDLQEAGIESSSLNDATKELLPQATQLHDLLHGSSTTCESVELATEPNGSIVEDKAILASTYEEETSFHFLDEVSDDTLDQLALEAARISQQILIAGDGRDSQSSASFPLEEEDSISSSPQDMTDNSHKFEGSCPDNRQLSPQLRNSGPKVSGDSDDPLEVDPFKRRSKLNSSPTPAQDQLQAEEIDPFKRRSKINSSPPPARKQPQDQEIDELKRRVESSPLPKAQIINTSLSKKEEKPVCEENSPVKRVDKVEVVEASAVPPNLNPEVNLSEAGPDIAQDETFQSSDVFKDPAAFDFLSQVGGSNQSVNLRTESLYVKFDPLYSGTPLSVTNKNIPLPSSIMANSGGDASNAMKSTVKSKVKEEKDSLELSSAGSTPRKEADVDNKGVSSPNAGSPIISPTPGMMKADSPEKYQSEQSSNGCTVEQQGVGRPVSMVGGLLPGGLTMAEVSMARELLARKEAEMEQRVTQEKARADVAEKKAEEALRLVAEKTQVENQMSVIMQEYEKTISRVVAEKEQLKQKWETERESLKRERDEALTHLNNVEQAFSDVHRKYERSKAAIEGFRANEDTLKASIAECQANLRKQEQRYDVLRSHAEAQLEGANQELESVRRSQQLEITKLRAMLKKTELRAASLEETVEQKEKENQELVAICDELIGKLGAVGVSAAGGGK